MLARLLLVLTLLPIAELFVMLAVHGAMAERFGTRTALGITLGMIVLTGIVGAALARWQGVAAMRAVREALARGEFPSRALLDAAMIVAGGALLLMPGYLTDLVGVTLLVPWARSLYRRALSRWLERQVAAGRASLAIRPGPSPTGSGPLIDITPRDDGGPP